MVGGEEASKGDGADDGVQCLKIEPVIDGFGHDAGEGSSGASESFRTYKRRKYARSSTDSKIREDGRDSVETGSKFADQTIIDDHLPRNHASLNGSENSSHGHWRKFILDYLFDSLREDDGGIGECIRRAHMEPDACDEARLRRMPHGTHHAAVGNLDVTSNGAFDGSHHHNVTEMCQNAFLSIILSEKFTSLCKLLFENFEGVKPDSLFSFSIISRRMKEGAYEHLPTLFYEDMEQFWRKLRVFGTELVSLAKSLLDVSKTCYNEKVGGSINCMVEDQKHEVHAQESGSRSKLEQTEDCCIYKVCTCRHCGNKADGSDCLVCDSCEEMYHISCIEPAVKEIPPKSWYCASCIGRGMGSPHENCVVCERLHGPRTLFNHPGNDIGPTNEETCNEFGEASNNSTDDGLQLSEGNKSACLCKFCGSLVENGERLKICNHTLCPNKYYHVRCLTIKQLKSYGPHWYCPCCLCRACLTDRDDDKIVLCDGCDHAYHLYCMIPPRNSIPKGKWFCRKCNVKIQQIRRVKRAYENKLRRKGEEVNRAFKNLKQESDKGGEGMDMLLNAALNYEEKFSGNQDELKCI